MIGVGPFWIQESVFFWIQKALLVFYSIKEYLHPDLVLKKMRGQKDRAIYREIKIVKTDQSLKTQLPFGVCSEKQTSRTSSFCIDQSLSYLKRFLFGVPDP